MIGLVVSGAGGAETIRDGFVEPAMARGWSVAITTTPTAARWLRAGGELPALEAITGITVRTDAELPGGSSPHPRVDLVVAAPASANTVAKLAIGLADNQALTLAAQAVGDVRTPVIVFPRINAAHARHPAWLGHLAALRSAGVGIVSGDEHWPLHEPGAAPPDRRLPWEHILDRVAAHLLARD